MSRSICIATIACIPLVVGCGPSITHEVRPVIETRRDSGIFSIDTIFDLKGFEIIELSDGIKTSTTTNTQFTLREVKLTVEVLYDRGSSQTEEVFWASWKVGEQKTLNTPARGKWEGVNAKGSAIIMNGESKVWDIKINLSWRPQ